LVKRIITDKIWPKSVQKLCVCEHAVTVSLGRPVNSRASAILEGSPFEDIGETMAKSELQKSSLKTKSQT